MLKRNKGFTLVELLVVIAIIGILSSVVLASLNSARQKSRDSKRVADIKQMQLALQLFFDKENKYPETISGGTDSTKDLVASGLLPQEPKDPSNASSGSYPYARSSDRLNYHLGASLESATTLLQGSDKNCNSTGTAVSSVPFCTGAAASAGMVGGSIAGFDGTAPKCGVANNVGTYCYDVVP